MAALLRHMCVLEIWHVGIPVNSSAFCINVFDSLGLSVVFGQYILCSYICFLGADRLSDYEWDGTYCTCTSWVLGQKPCTEV